MRIGLIGLGKMGPHGSVVSLIERRGSRDESAFAKRWLAALRNRFGGHALETKRENQ